jgi:hypothetical protein
MNKGKYRPDYEQSSKRGIFGHTCPKMPLFDFFSPPHDWGGAGGGVDFRIEM